MREATFRQLLAARLGERSVDSYLAYCRRVERELGIDLDQCDLSPTGLSSIEAQLKAKGVAPGSLGNLLSGLRAYAGVDAGVAPSMRVTNEQRHRWKAATATSPFNRWLDSQICDENGRLDLERLYETALTYGIDKRNSYSALNPGQQRMNIGNALRRVVPTQLYLIDGTAEVAAGKTSPTIAPLLESRLPRDTIRQASVGQLLMLYGEVMDELRSRGVVRTGNSPVGDYAELLFSRAFGWELESNSASGHDAVDSAGMRYQIKARRLGTSNASRQLSAIRRLEDQSFDYLAAVLFDPIFKVTRAIILPHSVVVTKAKRAEHTNSWRFILDDRIWMIDGARDVTAELAVAASQL